MTIVAIVDSGLNLKHRDIVESLWVNHKEIPGNGLDDDSNGAIDDVHGFDTLTSAGLNALWLTLVILRVMGAMSLALSLVWRQGRRSCRFAYLTLMVMVECPMHYLLGHTP